MNWKEFAIIIGVVIAIWIGFLIVTPFTEEMDTENEESEETPTPTPKTTLIGFEKPLRKNIFWIVGGGILIAFAAFALLKYNDFI